MAADQHATDELGELMMDRSYVVPWGTRGAVLADAEAAALVDLVHDDVPLSLGNRRDCFERAFAALVGSKHAISVTSGTVALELAIQMLDLEPGDEVIATPQTYQATVQPLLDYDVRVRFCDIDPATLNIDPSALEALITPRTRALLLVHYGGCPAEMDAIMALARRHDFLVLEDCAHALGADYRGRTPGALADIATFSFQNAKNITTLGEGGMITCSRGDWAERLDRLRSNETDAEIAPTYPSDVVEPIVLPWMKYSASVYTDAVRRVRHAGTNATLSEAAAAVGLTQLGRLGAVSEARRAIAGRLDEVVNRYPFMSPQSAPPHSAHAYHLYTCFADRQELRDQLVLALDRRGVEIQLRYFPQHLLPEWRHRGHAYGECPVAERMWFEQHLNLPCNPRLKQSQVAYLVDALDESLAELNGSPSLPLRVSSTVTCEK
ncbi:DegT/DnrJ/EryC1/StrS family aminotransferase [Streptomyces silvisoli]|uniref:DegT/DnrJ/EryC1/StrS family aminotransferase n=1 Tax=Streptomyces silvisoli TaxID=3034235 RepID=A0ABT5ZY67_9ACTN|nr:DegT/DnrJ/EryC1/StrS family aminotransferase [Streptomyces silvisoli]MDF3293948.1 DegT/DnrJ/EryC1/StrS family aminotransferase [Streptomyces silvisoli]